jgi:EAL domain-containing protein (putative c-di-GMP-specific phosphodiesterase class I)
VAEGVESEATLERLAELQCDYAQGYHFSRPVLGGRLSGRIPAGNEFSPATTARH